MMGKLDPQREPLFKSLDVARPPPRRLPQLQHDAVHEVAGGHRRRPPLGLPRKIEGYELNDASKIGRSVA